MPCLYNDEPIEKNEPIGNDEIPGNDETTNNCESIEHDKFTETTKNDMNNENDGTTGISITIKINGYAEKKTKTRKSIIQYIKPKKGG